MKKTVKYIIGIAIGIALLMGSVTITPLDEHKAQQSGDTFDAKTFATNLVENEIPKLEALSLQDFLVRLENDREALCTDLGKKLGVSDTYSFLVKGDVVVTEKNDEALLVETLGENPKKIAVATDFIFGNAVRDASGLVDIGDFQDTMDFNTISIEINNWVREKTVASLKESMPTDTLSLFGAVQVNRKNAALGAIPRAIPIQTTKK